jgi:hypothetical protein
MSENPQLSLAEYQAELEEWYAYLPDHKNFRAEWWYDFLRQIQEGDEIWEWNTMGGFTGSTGYVKVFSSPSWQRLA